MVQCHVNITLQNKLKSHNNHTIIIMPSGLATDLHKKMLIDKQVHVQYLFISRGKRIHFERHTLNSYSACCKGVYERILKWQ